jgi:cyclophilin family peptidyl-prolyl cis-trans isomerase
MALSQHRGLLDEIVYWGTFMFTGFVATYLLVSLINTSFEEETQFLQQTQYRKMAKVVTVHTSLGNFSILLSRAEAPLTVNNFVALADGGFYDRTKVHRVVNDLLIQGGDPLSREEDRDLYGTGGPGYVFEDENLSKEFERGSVAMANLGKKNTNGSQFFVTVGEAPGLDGKYTIFGRVINGMEIVDAINAAPVDENDIPVKPIIVERVEVE